MVLITNNVLLCLNSKWRDCTVIKLCLNKYLPVITNNRGSKYYQYNYKSKIEEAVNIQIKAEQQAGQDYLNLAVAFLHPSRSQFGVGGFFLKMYKEELDHMQKLINYQLLRGGVPLICGLQPPTENKDITLLEAFKKGLDMEKNITVVSNFYSILSLIVDIDLFRPTRNSLLISRHNSML